MIYYPKADDETVVEWYRRATTQHKYRDAFKVVVDCVEAGLRHLHREEFAGLVK
jgi:hypothetical protein